MICLLIQNSLQQKNIGLWITWQDDIKCRIGTHVVTKNYGDYRTGNCVDNSQNCVNFNKEKGDCVECDEKFVLITNSTDGNYCNPSWWTTLVIIVLIVCCGVIFIIVFWIYYIKRTNLFYMRMREASRMSRTSRDESHISKGSKKSKYENNNGVSNTPVFYSRFNSQKKQDSPRDIAGEITTEKKQEQMELLSHKKNSDKELNFA